MFQRVRPPGRVRSDQIASGHVQKFQPGSSSAYGANARMELALAYFSFVPVCCYGVRLLMRFPVAVRLFN